MNPYQKPLLHQKAERERRAVRERALSGMVGREFLYHGPDDFDREARRLYPERVGRRCVVMSVTYERVRAPLIIEWPDGFRGIAEASWLVGVEVPA